MSYLAARDFGLDTDTYDDPEPLAHALRRRIDGRYPIDGYGLDPQLSDLTAPLFESLVRVLITGGEHVPSKGAAVLVVNRGRGFGIAEPAALRVAVRRASGRRVRVVGVPGIPVLDSLARRLGAIGTSAEDVRTCLRAEHLVAVPLTPTWLRRGAGMPPRQVMRAMTHAPIIPVAVKPGGPLNAAILPWRVRFGALVTLPESYDPDDPLVAARFSEAVHESVSELLTQT